MKFCPVCKTSYDEEILRFCTKDGSPLVEEGQPNFTALPSENDLGEDTVIRRKTPPPIPSTAQPVPDFEPDRVSSPRIVIPMDEEGEVAEEKPSREAVRTKTTPSIRRPPPEKSNTAMVVFLTVIGTVVVLAGATGIFWFLSNQNSNVNQNVNYNTNFNSIDININANVSNSIVNFNYNINSNSNVNANTNVNANANLKSPTPTRTPTPTPTPGTNSNANSAINMDTNALPVPTRTPIPRPTQSPTPRNSPTPDPSGRPVNAGVLNSRAVNLPKPAFPPLAKQMRAAGQVAVQVLLDKAGNVMTAKAMSGNSLLRAPAEAAARQSKFNPVRVNNQPVPASGIVLYNFIN
jgi:hypothetical protein